MAEKTPDQTQEDFAWDNVNGKASDYLRAPKVVPVPAGIIAAAQLSFDGEEVNGEVLHHRRHRFASVEMAEAFAAHLKNAGLHTTPHTSISIAVDPDNNGDRRTVAWYATKRRGRGAASSAVAASAS